MKKNAKKPVKKSNKKMKTECAKSKKSVRHETPYVEKNISDADLIEMFKLASDGGPLYDYTAGAGTPFNKRLNELVDRAIELGSEDALLIKATNLFYLANCDDAMSKKYEIAAATEELITKFKNYEALCEYGFANDYIDQSELYKYYKEAMKLGYCVDEKLARMTELGIGTKRDAEAALKIRKEAYKKYKSKYQKNKGEYLAAEKYAYAAYNLAKGILDYNDAKGKSRVADKECKEYLKEAKKILKGRFLVGLVPLTYEEFEDQDFIENNIRTFIDDALAGKEVGNDSTHTYPMTISRLKEMCEYEIANGNGDMMILISQDDEGNGYHPLFWGFNCIDAICDEKGKIDPYYGNLLYGKMNKNNTILLS